MYAQQLKEKHTKIGETRDRAFTSIYFASVKSRIGMMRGSRVETAVVPIISSAVNIRDHYIRQLRHMDWSRAHIETTKLIIVYSLSKWIYFPFDLTEK